MALSLSSPARAQSDPLFADGVAAGDVTASTAVLWTRTSRDATITLEISRDPGFVPVNSSVVLATSLADDHTAKAEVSGLLPDSVYYYRWREGATLSETGTFHTAPIPWRPASVRFAWSGDSDGTLNDGVPAYGNYEVLDSVLADQPAFFIYLGDIVYQDSAFREAPARTLDEYRATYSYNRDIPAYRNLVQSMAIFPMWDDHEVANDWYPSMIDLDRFANGRQAFLEHIPIQAPRIPADPECLDRPLFRHFRWGEDVEMIILDERSCRSPSAEEACRHPDGSLDLAPRLPSLARIVGGLTPSPPAGCLDAIADPSRTFIGRTQKWLLEQYLLYSTAKFKFVISEVAIQQYLAWPYDRWEGYAAERAEILNFIRDHDIENVIFLTADSHANIMGDVVPDFLNDRERVATEFVTGPIATMTLASAVEVIAGVPPETLNMLVDYLPMRCWDLDAFGYGVVDVDTVAGTATISLRDQAGEILRSQGDPDVECVQTFGR